MSAAAHVEEIVRRHFESDETDFAGGAPLELARAVKALELDARNEVTIRSLRLVSLDGDEAQLEVEGHERSSVGRRRGPTVSFSGPVHARVEDCEWKVVDHCVDGRRISESFVTLTGEPVRVPGLTVTVRSIWLDSRWVYAFLDIDNDGERPAKLQCITLKVKRRSCEGRASRLQLEPRRSRSVALRWRRSLAPDTPPFRVRLEMRRPDRRYSVVSWRVDPGAGTAEGSARDLPQIVGAGKSPKAGYAIFGVFLAAYVAAYGVPPPSFFVGLAVIFGLIYLHQRLRS